MNTHWQWELRHIETAWILSQSTTLILTTEHEYTQKNFLPLLKKKCIKAVFSCISFSAFSSTSPSSPCYHCLFYFFDLCWFLNIATFLLFLLFPAIFLYPFLSLCLVLPLVFVCLVLLGLFLFFCKNNRFEVSIWMLKDILKYQFKTRQLRS